MQCQECQKKPAAVHYTKIVNNQKTEFHLCENCAREKGELDLSFSLDPGFSINDLLTGLLDMESTTSPVAKHRSAQCEACGLSYSEFRRQGRLGCVECYQAFERQLEPLLRRIQGSTKHSGKVPERMGGAAKVEQEIKRLTRELERAVDDEAYEEAAKLRDRVRQLRDELNREQEEGKDATR